MQLEVPYFEQKTDHTCGPAVMRMVFSFLGCPNITGLKTMLDTNPETGTKNEDLVTTAKDLGFSVKVKSGATISKIRKYLDKGMPVVVNFIEPRGNREGHYSLIVGMTHNEIIFNDPAYGQGFRMTIKQFEKDWRSGFENYERWMMVVMPKQSLFSIFKSFIPAKVFVKNKN